MEFRFKKVSCVIESRAFDKAVKRAPNVSPLSRIFLAFSIIAIGEWYTEILIRHFLSFGLFDYKRDTHKFLKARVRYSPVDSGFYHYGFLF